MEPSPKALLGPQKPASAEGSRGIDGIMRPRSIAVIGASSTKNSIGRQILRNLILYEFQGKVFPVNLKADVIQSIKAYPSVLDIPDPVDLAIVVVPRQYVAKVATQCGKKGVKGMVVITAGFKEAGRTGVQMEKEILEITRKYKMRMIGPNCFGVVNTDPAVRMNATFGKTFPGRGKIAFVTQSGALGEAIMVKAEELGIGFSMVASVGNKADISGNDMLEYWSHDSDTDIILMYLENFGNPRKFIKIARELSRRKPIVVVKSGRTAQGARAASSHTGSLAGMDISAEALFVQSGVIRVDTVEALFDLTVALANQPIPKGRRVGIITNAGGPAILATDSLISQGLEAPPISEKTKKKLAEKLPPGLNISNPLDLIAGAGPKEFEAAMRIMSSAKEFDAIIPIFVPPITVDPKEVSRAMVRGLSKTKTTLACFMGVTTGSEGVSILRENSIPVYQFPEAIGKTLERLTNYREWLDRPTGQTPKFKVKKSIVSAIVKSYQDSDCAEIIGSDALTILEAYGIPTAGYLVADSAQEAISCAGQIGYPVVMKIDSPKILHKTEVGGVILDLRSAEEISAAFEKLQAKLVKNKIKGALSVSLQSMVKGGVETVMGMTYDPTFGPLIMFGLGGIYVEVMKDVSFRINPLTDMAAIDMIKSVKSYPLLKGFRGSKSVSFEALSGALLRLSQLVVDFPQFQEIDVNPFMSCPAGKRSRAVDARFILQKDAG
ncbi:MAG: acetate--CoA ligase family protein [candidate division Zixibacteria bacterium]|nr:acetate--CoA ligase family protein [candidate division Zixibacteria bacterium]